MTVVGLAVQSRPSTVLLFLLIGLLQGLLFVLVCNRFLLIFVKMEELLQTSLPPVSTVVMAILLCMPYLTDQILPELRSTLR